MVYARCSFRIQIPASWYSTTMSTIDAPSLKNICATIQMNCAISDARHARDYSMCIYLLRMRDFYRWKHNIPLNQAIDTAGLGKWVADTESYWDEIEHTEFQPIKIHGKQYDPFDASSISEQLEGSDIVYGAGIGRLGQPHFVLAERSQKLSTDKSIPANCVECGVELARDSIPVPAATQNNTIYLRRESLLQVMWQMYEEWSIKKPPGPMSRLVAHYDIRNGHELMPRLKIAADDLGHLLIHHEHGEIQCASVLGKSYSELTYEYCGRPGEFQIRAIRDLLADTLSTWPFIIKHKAPHYLDFWLATVNGLREDLLKNTKVYTQLLGDGTNAERLSILEKNVDAERSRWQFVAQQLLAAYGNQGDSFNVSKTVNESLSSTL